jgi:hypothetical protein
MRCRSRLAFQAWVWALAACGVDTSASSDEGEQDTGTDAPLVCESNPSPSPWNEGPFVPEACGSWSESELLPASEPAPTSCADGGPCPSFDDVTEEAGLLYAQYTPTTTQEFTCLFAAESGDSSIPNSDCEPGWMTGGVAVGDYDDDGWPDLYVTRLGQQDLLFHNLGDGTFEEVAEQHGLGGCSFSNGAVWTDIEGDGDLDLYVTTVGDSRHYFYRNDGGCFVEDAAERGLDLAIDGMHVGQSIAVGDYDQDGALDLHVNEWIRTPVMDHGGNAGSRLLHNRGDGTFEDLTTEAGVTMAPSLACDVACGLSSTFVDLDDDGRLDLAVAADFQTSRMFWNEGDGTFSDGTLEAAVNDEGNAMGSAFGDWDLDGRLDWFVTAIADPAPNGCAYGEEDCVWRGTGNRLYRNLGDRTFEDVTAIADVRDSGWAWGTSFADFDNDGDADLVATNGWRGRDLYGGFNHLSTPMNLWINDGTGVMSEEGALRGVTDTGHGRGLVVFDYDRDGDLDIFVANHGDRPVLYRNDGGDARPWLTVEAVGSSGDRDARGAVITVEPGAGAPIQVRQVGVRSHYLGEGELPVHFGLGDTPETIERVTVRWPASGQSVTLSDVASRQRLVVEEP